MLWRTPERGLQNALFGLPPLHARGIPRLAMMPYSPYADVLQGTFPFVTGTTGSIAYATAPLGAGLA